MDLIDRQAAIDAIVNTLSEIGLHDNSEVARYGATFRQHEIIDIIECMPSVQSERKTGRWIVKTVNTFEMAYGSTGYEPVYECSLCGGVEESYLRFDEPIMPEDANFPNYCPHCGAKMKEDTDETD